MSSSTTLWIVNLSLSLSLSYSQQKYRHPFFIQIMTPRMSLFDLRHSLLRSPGIPRIPRHSDSGKDMELTLSATLISLGFLEQTIIYDFL